MSGAVVIRLAGEGVQLQPEDFAPALSMKAVGPRLEPQLDDQVLLDALAPRMRKIALAPKDASFRIVGGTPRVVPSKNGVTFDPDDVTGPFLRLVTKTGADRVLPVKSVTAKPEFTTADARRLGVKERVSAFTTNFPYAEYRNVNLSRAAELLNGTVLEPGETFSLNKTVGERTPANGFTKGFVISDGIFKEDFGGGVSQVATTTFNAAFFAGLEDVEHKPHSFYIDRYPVGREATVAWGSVDLKFKNTTPYGVYIAADVDASSPSTQGAMHVAMYSTKYWDIKAEQSERYNVTSPKTRRLSGPKCVPNQGYGGFDIDVFRLFYRAGSTTLDHRETMHTHYTPSDSVVCSG
jgi:vancomycin resistance protein YoaR